MDCYSKVNVKSTTGKRNQKTVRFIYSFWLLLGFYRINGLSKSSIPCHCVSWSCSTSQTSSRFGTVVDVGIMTSVDGDQGADGENVVDKGNFDLPQTL